MELFTLIELNQAQSSHRRTIAYCVQQRNYPVGMTSVLQKISTHTLTGLQNLGATSQESYALTIIRQPRFVLPPVLFLGST